MINTIAGFGVVVISYASTFGLVCLRSIYKNFPLPEFLDSIYLNSRILQSIFSYRFGANGSESSFERDAHHLAAICGLQFESIDAHAMDGFSLALHHVYIATDRPNKQHPLLLLPHLLQSSRLFPTRWEDFTRVLLGTCWLRCLYRKLQRKQVLIHSC
jgi:hypothetical protein